MIVRRLHAEGWQVVFLDRDRSAGTALVDELDSAAGTTYIACDLLDRGALLAAVDAVIAVGSVGLLVNNAGGWMPGAQFPDGDQWERGLELNLHVPMLLTKLFLPALEGGGAVVNIASSGGWSSRAYGSPE